MSFSEIYTSRLQSLPQDLRDGSVQYDKLHGIIQCTVDELTVTGLSAQILREFVAPGQVNADNHEFRETGVVIDHTTKNSKAGNTQPSGAPRPRRVAYELKAESGQLISQLRVWVSVHPSSRQPKGNKGRHAIADADLSHTMESLDCPRPPELERAKVGESGFPIISPLHHAVIGINFPLGIGKTGDINSFGHGQPGTLVPNAKFQVTTADNMDEVEIIVPLVRDGEFFTTLSRDLEDVSSQLKKLHSVFSGAIADLARTIEETCRPASVAADFRPYSSISTHPGTIEVRDKSLKSDLYAWRHIFRLFIESEIFEHDGQGKRCEWSLDESERRLKSFVDKVSGQFLPFRKQMKQRGPLKEKGKVHVGGSSEKFQYQQSTGALEAFIGLNLLALSIKKFSYVNAEAIEDLLRIRAERCALPTPFSSKDKRLVSSLPLTVPLHVPPNPLQRVSFTILESLASEVLKAFAHSIECTLFPVVPSLDDYSCAICMCIAFKPIRLSCMHLFCVRCLVKMQKRGEGNCPMCRAPSVLNANSKNVDWAVLNFMEDWFPREAREKLKANEKEVTAELYAEWGGNPCCVL